MKVFVILLSAILIFAGANAQPPHLSGKVEIVMATGQVTCSFLLSNIPNLGKDYQILLNKGFNIKSIKDSTHKTLDYSGFYNGKMKGEGLAYVPEIQDSTLVNPSKLYINYTGAFPIYTDTLNFLDFKGLIAFNGKTMRAADQSKWYPVIYDVKNDRMIDQLTYDIEVISKDAKNIFVNGDLPKPGPAASFTSDIAIAPMLFVGNYDVQKTAGAVFLNTDMNEKQLSIFEDNIREIKAYYFKVLKIPYETKNVFIEHQPVEKFKPGRSWGFVSFPVIAFAGIRLADMVDEKNARLKDTADYAYFAHEIGHYYFGNVLRPNSPLFWFFLESMAEYLSVKAGEAKYGRQFGIAYFKNKARDMAGFKAKPLNAITDMNQISGNYRYHYGPVLLRGLEQLVGEQRTFNFLHTCLTAAPGLTNYDFFHQSALRSGITQTEWEIFEKQFLLSENAMGLIKPE